MRTFELVVINKYEETLERTVSDNKVKIFGNICDMLIELEETSDFHYSEINYYLPTLTAGEMVEINVGRSVVKVYCK